MSENPMLVAQRLTNLLVDALVDDPDAVLTASDAALERAYWTMLRGLSSEFGPGWGRMVREHKSVRAGQQEGR